MKLTSLFHKTALKETVRAPCSMDLMLINPAKGSGALCVPTDLITLPSSSVVKEVTAPSRPLGRNELLAKVWFSELAVYLWSLLLPYLETFSFLLEMRFPLPSHLFTSQQSLLAPFVLSLFYSGPTALSAFVPPVRSKLWCFRSWLYRNTEKHVVVTSELVPSRGRGTVQPWQEAASTKYQKVRLYAGVTILLVVWGFTVWTSSPCCSQLKMCSSPYPLISLPWLFFLCIMDCPITVCFAQKKRGILQYATLAKVQFCRDCLFTLGFLPKLCPQWCQTF